MKKAWLLTLLLILSAPVWAFECAQLRAQCGGIIDAEGEFTESDKNSPSCNQNGKQNGVWGIIFIKKLKHYSTPTGYIQKCAIGLMKNNIIDHVLFETFTIFAARPRIQYEGQGKYRATNYTDGKATGITTVGGINKLGKPHGEIIIVNDSFPTVLGNFENGKKHGKWSYYVLEANVWCEETYLNGKKMGKTIPDSSKCTELSETTARLVKDHHKLGEFFGVFTNAQNRSN